MHNTCAINGGESNSREIRFRQTRSLNIKKKQDLYIKTQMRTEKTPNVTQSKTDEENDSRRKKRQSRSKVALKKSSSQKQLRGI